MCVLSPLAHQEHLVKQGMKADQASSLVEITAAKCSTVKYDVELAEEYIARQVTFATLTDMHEYPKKCLMTIDVFFVF